MTTVVPPEGEDLLRAAALGHLDRTAPEVAARLQADPELLRAVDELERTRETTARVLREGAELTERARAEATSADRTLVRETLQSLARGGESNTAGGRRGWIVLFAGLAAAAVIGFFFARGSRPAPPAPDVWLGPDIGFERVESAGGLGSLRWNAKLHAGEEFELSFYALREGQRQELLLGPKRLKTNEWQPTAEEARVLASDWLAELRLIDGSGEGHPLGQLRHSSSR